MPRIPPLALEAAAPAARTASQEAAGQAESQSAGNLLPGPWVEPQNVADAVVFLASDRAKFVTGSQFALNAGLLTR